MEKKKSNLKWIIIAILFIVIIVAGVIFGIPIITEQQKIKSGEVGKINDWEYNPSEHRTANNSKSFGGINQSSLTGSIQNSADAVPNSTIGLSTGGAKDAENFRENIRNGYFPISTDITYNGLFYDYYFDTKNANNENETQSNQLFSPSYSTAVSKDPISNEDEYYMTIGLNSRAADGPRPGVFQVDVPGDQVSDQPEIVVRVRDEFRPIAGIVQHQLLPEVPALLFSFSRGSLQQQIPQTILVLPHGGADMPLDPEAVLRGEILIQTDMGKVLVRQIPDAVPPEVLVQEGVFRILFV